MPVEAKAQKPIVKVQKPIVKKKGIWDRVVDTMSDLGSKYINTVKDVKDPTKLKNYMPDATFNSVQKNFGKKPVAPIIKKK